MGVSVSAGWYLESRDWSWRLFSLKQVEDRVAISSGVPFLAYTNRIAQWSRLITVLGLILAQSIKISYKRQQLEKEIYKGTVSQETLFC